MKLMVRYYDIETNRCIEKPCDSFQFDNVNREFSFCPFEKGDMMYKNKIVKDASIHINYRDNTGMLITVSGWMKVKDDGYWKHDITLRYKDENDYD